MTRLAFEPAAAFYDQAMAALAVAPAAGDGGLRCQLHLARGSARNRSGDHGAWDDYVAAAGLARERGDADALGQAALGLADVWVWSWHHSDAVRIDLLDDALAAQGGADTALRARLAARLAGQLYWVPGSLPRRQALAAESVTVARRLGDPAALAACLDSTTFAGVDSRRGRAAPGRRRGDRRPGPAGGRPGAGAQRPCLVPHRQPGGERPGRPRCRPRRLRDVRRRAGPGPLPVVRPHPADMRAILAGDLDTGEALAHEAHASGRVKEEGDAEPLFGCQMSLVWQERPSPDAADHRETLRRLYVADPPRVPTLVAAARAHGIVLALGAGRDGDVRADLDELPRSTSPPWNPRWPGPA